MWNVIIEIGCIDGPTVARTWVDECMIRLKHQLILRLAEAQSVQQWLLVEEQRALSRVQNRLPAEEREGPEEVQFQGVQKEKEFLLTTAIQIRTNPVKLPDQAALRNMGYLKGWMGNHYICQVTHNRKLVFNHSVWSQYQVDQDQDREEEERWMPFGDGPRGLILSDY